jgi:hypothetical protein
MDKIVNSLQNTVGVDNRLSSTFQIFSYKTPLSHLELPVAHRIFPRQDTSDYSLNLNRRVRKLRLIGLVSK